MTLRQLRSALGAAGISGQRVTQDQVETLGAEKGAYVLALELPALVDLKSAKLAGWTLEPGRYVYAGSAKGTGGLRARLKRHLQEKKKIHWHIDQLTLAASSTEAFAVIGGDECDLVTTLLRHPEFEIAAPGFGSTDCRRCPSHLLRVTAQSS